MPAIVALLQFMEAFRKKNFLNEPFPQSQLAFKDWCH